MSREGRELRERRMEYVLLEEKTLGHALFAHEQILPAENSRGCMRRALALTSAPRGRRFKPMAGRVENLATVSRNCLGTVVAGHAAAPVSPILGSRYPVGTQVYGAEAIVKN